MGRKIFDFHNTNFFLMVPNTGSEWRGLPENLCLGIWNHTFPDDKFNLSSCEDDKLSMMTNYNLSSWGWQIISQDDKLSLRMTNYFSGWQIIDDKLFLRMTNYRWQIKFVIQNLSSRKRMTDVLPDVWRQWSPNF